MKFTKKFIINYLKEYYDKYNKSPIILDISHPFKYSDIQRLFRTWNNALLQAGLPLNKRKPQPHSYKTKASIIKYMKDYYKQHNKSPIIVDTIHPFSYNQVKKLFKTWNNALIEAGLPLNRNDVVITECRQCGVIINKQHKEMIKSYNDFCSHTCSATFNNKGRKMSEETKEKIRKKLQVERYTKCKMCKIEFRYYKRKNQTCGDKCLSDLKKLINLKKKVIVIDSDSE